MIGYLKFSLSYFFITALICAIGWVPLCIRIYENQQSNVFDGSAIVDLLIATLLLLFFVAVFLTISFRLLNGPVNLRPVSAIVLVFLVSVAGIAISSVIVATFGVILSWLTRAWVSIDSLIFISTYKIFDYTVSPFALSYFPSLSMAFSSAVLGALFGLPLARIGRGVRLVDAWSDQAGKRWMLFWRCWIGSLALSVIWAIISLIAHFSLIEPTLTNSKPSNLDTNIDLITAYQPTLLEVSFSYGMNMMSFSLSVGLVAFLAEHVRQKFG